MANTDAAPGERRALARLGLEIANVLSTDQEVEDSTFLGAPNARLMAEWTTPTHGSWLNQIELWFSIVSRRVLRYGNFHSLEQLVACLEDFIETWNRREAKPFRWTYDGLPLVR